MIDFCPSAACVVCEPPVTLHTLLTPSGKAINLCNAGVRDQTRIAMTGLLSKGDDCMLETARDFLSPRKRETQLGQIISDPLSSIFLMGSRRHPAGRLPLWCEAKVGHQGWILGIVALRRGLAMMTRVNIGDGGEELQTDCTGRCLWRKFG